MENCVITMEEIADYRDRTASEEVFRAVGAHVGSHCPECVSRLEWLNRTAYAIAVSSPLIEPPTKAAIAARGIFWRERAADAVRMLVASLSFDSVAAPAYATSRDMPQMLASEETSRRLYSAEGFSIDVSEQRTVAGSYVIAQVFNASSGEILMPASASAFPAHDEPIDARFEDAEMHFEMASREPYALHIDAGGMLFVVPPTGRDA